MEVCLEVCLPSEWVTKVCKARVHRKTLTVQSILIAEKTCLITRSWKCQLHQVTVMRTTSSQLISEAAQTRATVHPLWKKVRKKWLYKTGNMTTIKFSLPQRWAKKIMVKSLLEPPNTEAKTTIWTCPTAAKRTHQTDTATTNPNKWPNLKESESKTGSKW